VWEDERWHLEFRCRAHIAHNNATGLYVEQLRKRSPICRSCSAEHSQENRLPSAAKASKLIERIKPKLEARLFAPRPPSRRRQVAADRAAAARTQQVRADARVNTIQQAEMELLEKRLLALGAKPDELPSARLCRRQS
jgi:DNA repair exonuclease SbcCD ATPase subunit